MQQLPSLLSSLEQISSQINMNSETRERNQNAYSHQKFPPSNRFQSPHPTAIQPVGFSRVDSHPTPVLPPLPTYGPRNAPFLPSFTSPSVDTNRPQLPPIENLISTSHLPSANYRKISTISKDFVCDFPNCNKSYTRKYNLQSHQLSAHSHIRPYPCPMCPAQFSRPHDLRRHSRSKHSSYKPFVCPDCGMTFARSDALKRHFDRDLGRRERGGKSCKELVEFKRLIEENTVFEPNSKQVGDLNVLGNGGLTSPVTQSTSPSGYASSQYQYFAETNQSQQMTIQTQSHTNNALLYSPQSNPRSEELVNFYSRPDRLPSVNEFSSTSGYKVTNHVN